MILRVLNVLNWLVVWDDVVLWSIFGLNPELVASWILTHLVLMVQNKLDYLHSCLCSIGIRLVQVCASHDVIGINDPGISVLIPKRFMVDRILEDFGPLIQCIKLWGGTRLFTLLLLFIHCLDKYFLDSMQVLVKVFFGRADQLSVNQPLCVLSQDVKGHDLYNQIQDFNKVPFSFQEVGGESGACNLVKEISCGIVNFFP